MTSFPFQIDRNAKANLPEQVAEGFRKCMRSGRYKPGDVLPSRGEIARALGISVRVPREAMAILAAENFVRPRRGVGCTVLARGETLWKGRVLALMLAPSYYATTLEAEARRRLVRAGYQYSCTTLDLKGKGFACDVGPLEDALRQPVDFVIAVFQPRNVLRLLRRRRVPLFCVDGDAGRDGLHTAHASAATKRFLEQCRACGVRRVLYLSHGGGYRAELAAMRAAGLVVEWKGIGTSSRTGILERLEHNAMNFVMRRFAPGRSRPDLVYFADDYLARGGLIALLARGVRVPGDVKVVVLANKGFEPVFPMSLARFVADPEAVGAYAAERAMSHIEGRCCAMPPPEKAFVPGATFPAMPNMSADKFLKGTKGTLRP